MTFLSIHSTHRICLWVLFIFIIQFSAHSQDSGSQIPPAPLFRDPVFDGAADPTVFWNYQEQNWWLIYTQRRANLNAAELAWVHGTAIGIASSDDGGLHWNYRGTLDLSSYKPGHNTFWAPDIYWDGHKYYFFVSYVEGIPYKNFDDKHKILLFEGTDMWNLTFTKALDLGSERVIDPTVIQLPNGSYRLWFKNENAGYTTHYADSKDLINWSPKGPAVDSTNCEGANVFLWKERYWMITDPWNGIQLYSSSDAKDWKNEGIILSGIGQRKDDTAKGHHACVVPAGEFAYIFYHCNPEESFGNTESWSTIEYRQRRSVIQVARLRIEGDKVICDRDTPFPLTLKK